MKACLTTIFKLILLVVFITAGGIHSSNKESEKHLYVTWRDSMEIDKLTSAWVIKKFIDPKAQFRFVPKGTLIDVGIPFDTPDAEYRRYHNLACVEYIVRKHKLNDPAVLKLAAIVHDLEINTWGPKKHSDSIKTSDKMQELIKNSDNDEEMLQKGFIWLDEWYATMKKKDQ